jgi:general secretion pathway protein B
MSYILDALRKSDQQRQRGATPTLLTAQAAAAEPRQPAYWIYGLIAAVLVGAGIVIGWLHPWQSEQPTREGAPSAGETVAAKPPESSLRQTTPAPVPPAPGPVSPDMNRTPTQERPIQKSAAQPVPASSGAATTHDRPAPSLSNAETRGMPPNAVTTAPKEALTPVPEKSVTTGLTDPGQEPRVMTMGELPLSIRQELPSMQISLHLHSTKPANRFVSINNQMLQEGAYPAPGLRLEQITPDGMIFSYKGYRFRRGVQ